MRPSSAAAMVRSVFVAAVVHAAAVHAAPLNGLYVFGDSLSDPGNNAIAMGSTASPPFHVTLQSDITSNSFIPTYPYATSYQYSNAGVWAYQFATMLGLSSQVAGPVLGGGRGANYAYGGATTGPANSSTFPPSLLTQTAAFISSLGSASAPADALYVVAGGGNNARDALTAIAGGADPTATIAATAVRYAADIGDIVDALQGKGAVKIVAWDVPNVGLSPAIAANGPSAAALGTTLAQAMNNALGNRLASETGVQIFDIFALVTSVNANPGAYGLINATDAAGAISGADPSQYLCWDGLHPTSAGHAILAQSMYAAVVPEPSNYLLVIAGLVPALAAARRRSAPVAPTTRVPQVENLRPLSKAFGHSENAARGCPCPGAGVADQRSHGWRSAVSIERAKPRMGGASVRRWASAVPSGAASEVPIAYAIGLPG